MPWWSCFQCGFRKAQGSITRELDFSYQTLSEVPPEIFQNLELEVLNLDSNRIKYLPRELFYCVELNTLTLRNNELEEIPSAIGHLTNLTHLDFSRNSISTLPENIKSCRHLQFLDLSSNSLYPNKVPESVTTLLNLTHLQMNDTGLDYLPANFGRLVNLKILELRDNNLITLPKTMGRLQHLQRLDIGENEFTELPEIVGQLIGLVELWIDNNRIRRLSPNIGNLKKLIHFDATNNMLPEIPPEIGQWIRVQEICLTGNELSTLPGEIGKLKQLFNLKVDENQLQSLPDEIGNLSSLEELMLSHNDLISLPSLGLLRKLRILTIDENLLRSLPEDITSCISLSVLSVRGNKLTKIPSDVGHLANLKVLNIVNNFIQHLPVSILNLQKLGALWISDNQSEPLIPLQKEYHADGNLTCLTCFMLPQTVSQQQLALGAMGRAGEEEEGRDPNAYNIYEAQPQFAGEPTHRTSDKQAKITDGLRKHICFAPPIPNGDIDLDDEGLESPNKRLLRSPTPYPKELHVLNKYAKNLQKQMQLQTSDVDESALYVDTSTATGHNTTPSRLNQIEIREAKVTSNNLINRNPANDFEMTEMRMVQDEQQHMMMNMEDEVSPLLNGDDGYEQSSAKIYTQIDRYNGYSRPPTKRNEATTQLLNGIDEFDSVSMQQHHHTMMTSPVPPQQLYTRPFSSTSFTSQPAGSEFLMSFDHSSRLNSQQSQNFDGSRLNTPTPSMISSQNSINHNRLPPLPPPYEIAKIFSKKTSAEYEIYEEIRSKQRQQNELREKQPTPQCTSPIVQMTNGYHSDPVPNADEQHVHPMANGFQEQADEPQNLNSYNNNVFDSGRHSIASELSATTIGTLDDGKRLAKPEMNEEKQMSDASSTAKDSINNNSKQQSSPEKKKWLFGLHKNPKVMQVRLHKNVGDTDFFVGYGFDISEKSQEPGIFVSHIQPNSVAEPLLKLNDKILDIDGNDFTKLTINEAKDILQEQHKQQQLVLAATSGIIANTDITLNIMLSRI